MTDKYAIPASILDDEKQALSLRAKGEYEQAADLAHQLNAAYDRRQRERVYARRVLAGWAVGCV